MQTSEAPSRLKRELPGWIRTAALSTLGVVVGAVVTVPVILLWNALLMATLYDRLAVAPLLEWLLDVFPAFAMAVLAVLFLVRPGFRAFGGGLLAALVTTSFLLYWLG